MELIVSRIGFFKNNIHKVIGFLFRLSRVDKIFLFRIE